jgi:hypothetical protein
MPTLFRHTFCPGCGHRHHFTTAVDGPVAGREYAFVCPETGQRASFRPAEPGEVVPHSPQGAVALEPAPEGARDVVPEVQELAGKVGGLARLSDLVRTVNEARE